MTAMSDRPNRQLLGMVAQKAVVAYGALRLGASGRASRHPHDLDHAPDSTLARRAKPLIQRANLKRPEGSATSAKKLCLRFHASSHHATPERATSFQGSSAMLRELTD